MLLTFLVVSLILNAVLYFLYTGAKVQDQFDQEDKGAAHELVNDRDKLKIEVEKLQKWNEKLVEEVSTLKESLSAKEWSRKEKEAEYKQQIQKMEERLIELQNWKDLAIKEIAHWKSKVDLQTREVSELVASTTELKELNNKAATEIETLQSTIKAQESYRDQADQAIERSIFLTEDFVGVYAQHLFLIHYFGKAGVQALQDWEDLQEDQEKYTNQANEYVEKAYLSHYSDQEEEPVLSEKSPDQPSQENPPETESLAV